MKGTVEERRSAFIAGNWMIEPELNALTRDDVQHHVEPKVMQVLLTLAARQNHVLSKQELITAVWPDTFVSEDVLTRCISILRRITGDDPHAPRFIQTVPKMGYRLVAPITELHDEDSREPTLYTAASAPPDHRAVQPVFAESHPGAQRLAVTLPPGNRGPGSRSVRWTALTTLVAVIALSGLAYSLRRSQSHPANLPASFRTVQFTSYAGEQTQPAFSPDGRRIAFVRVSEDGISRRICIKRIGDEALSELNAGIDQQFSPAWSPDGRQIAYLSTSDAGLGLFLADIAPGGVTRKLFIPQQPTHWEQGALSWSPDGKGLLFPDHQGLASNSSIFRLDLATREARAITTPPAGWEGDLDPVYSPDGSRIAFTRASETSVRDIFWMAAAGGALHQLTHDRMNIDSLAWNAGGSSILFSSNRGGKYGLWTIPLTGGRPERLPVGTEDAFQPSVGPRPGQFAYSQGSAIWSIVRLDRAARAAASQPAAILSSTQQDSAPSLAPDGRSFAMQSLRSGSQEIWIVSTDTGALRQLTFMGGPLTGSPAWSHRGDRILFDSRPDGHSHIFLAPAAGGRPQQLTFGDANDIVPRWSNDDQAVYFRSNRAGRWRLWRIAAQGGEPQAVTQGDGIEPQESPDGRWLYYTRGGEAGIWRVSTAGGPETQVFDQPAANYWGYWQVTPQGIVYLDLSRSPAQIRIFDPESRQSALFTTLNQSPPPYAGLTVGDRGNFVLATGERDAGRHITLVQSQP